MSLFEATYGETPPSIPKYLDGSSQVKAVDVIMSTRAQLHFDLQRHLSKAQDAMKRLADSHHHEVVYVVGTLGVCAASPILPNPLLDPFTLNSPNLFMAIFAFRSV